MARTSPRASTQMVRTPSKKEHTVVIRPDIYEKLGKMHERDTQKKIDTKVRNEKLKQELEDADDKLLSQYYEVDHGMIMEKVGHWNYDDVWQIKDLGYPRSREGHRDI